MDEQIKEVVEIAGKIQAVAAANKMQVEGRACIIAASNLFLAAALAKKAK